MPPLKTYCGPLTTPPDGHRIGNNVECMKKGFGICLYSGNSGRLHNPDRPPPAPSTEHPKIYCGLNGAIPDGARRGTRIECLRKGYGVCLYGPPQPIPILARIAWIVKQWWFWVILVLVLIIILFLFLYAAAKYK